MFRGDFSLDVIVIIFPWAIFSISNVNHEIFIGITPSSFCDLSLLIYEAQFIMEVVVLMGWLPILGL